VTDVLAVERHRWWRQERSVVAVGLSMAVVGINTTGIGVATRGIADDLGVSLVTVSWIVGGFLLTAASFSLVGGRLGDVVGRARTFVTGIAILAVGSLIAAVAPSSTVLIVGRVVQGLGAGLLMPASIELLAAYPPAAGVRSGFRVRGIVYASAFGIGPLVGGVLTDHVSWRALFWLELVLLIGAGLLALPLCGVSSGLQRAPTRDLTGAVLTSMLVFVVVGGAFRTPEWGLVSWWTVAAAAIAAVLAAVLVRVEVRAEHPLVHRDLLTNRLVLGANLATVAASVGMLGLIYFFSLFAQSAATFDSTALAAAAALVPFMASMVLFSHLADILTMRLGYRGPVLAGLGLVVVGFAWLSVTAAGTTELDLLLPLTLCGIGAGIANAGLTGTAVLTQSKVRIDEAAGLLSLSRFVGSALAVAIGTSTYLSVAVRLPAGTMAARSQQVMGGAVFHDAVATLRQDLRGPFVAAARTATAQAFATTMGMAAVGILVMTMVSAWLLRPGPVDPASAPDLGLS